MGLSFSLRLPLADPRGPATSDSSKKSTKQPNDTRPDPSIAHPSSAQLIATRTPTRTIVFKGSEPESLEKFNHPLLVELDKLLGRASWRLGCANR